MTLYTIGHLAKQYGVSTSTIRRWEAAGLIAASERTLGGHRRFRIEDNAGNYERQVVGYARVSSYDQKEDLQRQIVRLRNAGCDEVVSDIGSGLNCKKPGLKLLLTKLLFGKNCPASLKNSANFVNVATPNGLKKVLKFMTQTMGRPRKSTAKL